MKETSPAFNKKPALVSRDLALVLVAQMLFGLSYFAFFLLPKYLDIELNATATEIGNVTSILGISIVAGMVLAVVRIDAVGRKPYILTGALLSLATSLGFLLVKEIGPLIYFLRVFQGISFAFVVNAAAVYVTDVTDPKHYARSLGFWGASLMVSNGIAPYLLEPVADNFGWEYVFVAAGLAGLLSFVVSLFIRENYSRTPDRDVPEESSPLPRTTILASVYALAIAGAAFGIMFTYYQPFALSLGISRVSGFFVTFTTAVIVSRTLLSGIADRYGRRKTALAFLFLYGMSVMAMSRLRAGFLEIIGVSFGLAHGLCFPALVASSVEGVDSNYRGRIITLLNSFFNVGFTAGIFAAGPVIDRAGYAPVFIGTGLFVFTGIVPLALLRRKRSG